MQYLSLWVSCFLCLKIRCALQRSFRIECTFNSRKQNMCGCFNLIGGVSSGIIVFIFGAQYHSCLTLFSNSSSCPFCHADLRTPESHCLWREIIYNVGKMGLCSQRDSRPVCLLLPPSQHFSISAFIIF